MLDADDELESSPSSNSVGVGPTTQASPAALARGTNDRKRLAARIAASRRGRAAPRRRRPRRLRCVRSVDRRRSARCRRPRRSLGSDVSGRSRGARYYRRATVRSFLAVGSPSLSSFGGAAPIRDGAGRRGPRHAARRLPAGTRAPTGSSTRSGNDRIVLQYDGGDRHASRVARAATSSTPTLADRVDTRLRGRRPPASQRDIYANPRQPARNAGRAGHASPSVADDGRRLPDRTQPLRRRRGQHRIRDLEGQRAHVARAASCPG